MKKSQAHPYTEKMLTLSKGLQRSGFKVKRTKHGIRQLRVPDPPPGAAWMRLEAHKDINTFDILRSQLGQGMNKGKYGEQQAGPVNGVERFDYKSWDKDKSTDRHTYAYVVVEKGGAPYTGYLYLSDKKPSQVESTTAKLSSLLDSIRGEDSEPMDEAAVMKVTVGDSKRALEMSKKVVARLQKRVHSLSAAIDAMDPELMTKLINSNGGLRGGVNDEFSVADNAAIAAAELMAAAENIMARRATGASPGRALVAATKTASKAVNKVPI